MARRASDACADFLDRHHQRIGQQHRPADAVTELRTGLAVGPNARWVVIGRSRDQARTQLAQKLGRYNPLEWSWLLFENGHGAIGSAIGGGPCPHGKDDLAWKAGWG